MSFTGKATYTAGVALPEIAEDVSDLIAINSPWETPLLDAQGDPGRAARSTIHEWLEDALLPNTDQINDNDFDDALTDTEFAVEHLDRFRVGDQIQIEGSGEVMIVTGMNPSLHEITVTRGYGGSTTEALIDGAVVTIFGNAAMEGADASGSRFNVRSRKTNFTQIFTSTIEVSGSELAVKHLGVRDELDYQKLQRTRELLRDLENCVINGRASSVSPEGSATTRRTMRGIRAFIASNVFVPGVGMFPNVATLSEAQLNMALREIWKAGNGHVDTIVVNGQEKRAINQFVASNRRFTPNSDAFRDNVAIYENDFGICRIVMSRWIPAGTVLLLDSSRIDVMPLAGRSFHYKNLANTGDSDSGQLVGEYTVEMRNENAHGVIQGLG